MTIPTLTTHCNSQLFVLATIKCLQTCAFRHCNYTHDDIPHFLPLLSASATLLPRLLYQPADFQTPLFRSDVSSLIPEYAPTKMWEKEWKSEFLKQNLNVVETSSRIFLTQTAATAKSVFIMGKTYRRNKNANQFFPAKYLTFQHGAHDTV